MISLITGIISNPTAILKVVTLTKSSKPKKNQGLHLLKKHLGKEKAQKICGSPKSVRAISIKVVFLAEGHSKLDKALASHTFKP